MRSTSMRASLSGSLPNAWTPSQWMRVRGFLRRMRLAASATGKIAPVSLLTSIMLTSTVSSVTASATACGSIVPSRPGFR